MMDPERSRRYLHAMGVPVWRLRGTGVDTREGPGPGPEEMEGILPPTHAGDTMIPESAEPSDLGLDPPPQAVPEAIPIAGVAGMEWERLSETVVSCRACELCETRTQTVFGVGNRWADLMVVGEAPGADEDRQGEPFVGRAGQLLNLMLTAIGLEREQVFIANILKCRPLGNRDPRPEETLRCEPYLRRQIALVRPRVLLSVGRISAQKLLKTDDPIGKLRGRWFAFGPDEIPLTVTYHPAYLLRSPEQKSRAWQDLLKVARRLREAAGDSDTGTTG